MANRTPPFTHGLDLSNVVMNTSKYGSVLEDGNLGSANSVEVSSNCVPLQIYLKSIGDNPTSQYTIAGAYIKTGIETKDQSYIQACGVLARVKLDYDCDSAYGVQSHVGIGADMATAASAANIAAGSFKIDLDNDVTQGKVNAGLFIIEGTGSVTETCNVAEFTAENGSTVDNMLSIGGNGTATSVMSIGCANKTNLFNFTTSAGPVVSASVGGTQNKKLKCVVAGTSYYIPMHTS